MSKNNYPALKTILLDMDGVIWRGYEPVIDIKALFDKIHQLGCQPFCVTNNATSTVDEYLDKLRNYDVELSSDQILTSAEATAEYLEDHIQKGSSVYVIGEEGLKETIARHGFAPAPSRGTRFSWRATGRASSRPITSTSAPAATCPTSDCPSPS